MAPLKMKKLYCCSIALSKRLAAGFFWLLFIIPIGQGQWQNKFGLELEGGVLRANYSYEGLGLSAYYQFPFVRLKLNHFRSLIDHGSDLYGFFGFLDSHERIEGFEYVARRYYRRFNYTAIMAESEFRIGDFKFALGVGTAYQRLSDYKSYFVFQDALEYNKISPSGNFALIYRFAYRYKNLSFYLQNPLNSESVIGVNYSWKNKKLVAWDKSSVTLRDKKFKKSNSFLYLFFKTRYEVSLSRVMKSTATKFDIGLDVKIKNGYHLFGMMTLVHFGHGADKLDPAYFVNNSTSFKVNNSRKIEAISNIHLGIQRSNPYSSFVKFEYGLGLAHFYFNGPKYVWDLNGTETARIAKNVFGLVLKSQLRIGPFGNGLELQIPFWNMPPSLSYHWSIGLNFRKRGERIKPLNVYEKTKGWN